MISAETAASGRVAANAITAAEAYLAEVGEGAEPALTALQRDYVNASRASATPRSVGGS